MYGVILFFHVLIAVILIIVVLMQQRGGGLSTVFGGGGAESVFGGGGVAPFMVKLTSILAAIFVITSLTLVLMTKPAKRKVPIQKKPAATQPITPFEKVFPESAKGGK